MIQINITQTGSNKPGGDSSIFNKDSMKLETYEQALAWLERTYGIKPGKRLRGVFRDLQTGSHQVGFINARWNEDCSHPDPKWWEENWITFEELSPPTLPKYLKASK